MKKSSEDKDELYVYDEYRRVVHYVKNSLFLEKKVIYLQSGIEKTESRRQLSNMLIDLAWQPNVTVEKSDKEIKVNFHINPEFVKKYIKNIKNGRK